MKKLVIDIGGGELVNKGNYDLLLWSLQDNPSAVEKALNPQVGFTPNWKRLGLKSQKEGIKHVLNFLKREEKHLADRGYGRAEIKDGNLKTILVLKGSKIKRKKEVIQV